jgi:hypothetical protein
MAGKPDEPADALETLAEEDRIIDDLYEQWEASRRKLRGEESVETRWEKGSEGKLLLQHAAIRESAKEALAGRLREVGDTALADRVEGDGPTRRRAIARCDEVMRGRQAMAVNTPESDDALSELEAIIRAELPGEVGDLLPAARKALGPVGERGLPGARHIRRHAPTHPSAEPRWFDRVGPLKSMRAYYDHLRGSPSGGTKPGVDAGREHDPG